jgi:exopolysaccharide biosynthesis WecB/TagA/CpsF family protein
LKSGSPNETRAVLAHLRQKLLNIWVDDLSPAEVMAALDAEGGVVFTLNPDHLWHLQRNHAFLSAYRSADIVTVDSHYLKLALRFLGRPVRHRITGADFVPAYCDHLGRKESRQGGVFLLGARPGVALEAGHRINARVGWGLVVGARGPSMNFVDDPVEIEAVLTEIQASGATVLLVGLGAPKQEIFIAEVRQRLPQVKVILGVGATIDYEAGAVERAPAWMRRWGAEWLFRVVTDPRRYLSRYLRGAEFVGWVLMDRFGLYRDPLAG